MNRRAGLGCPAFTYTFPAPRNLATFYECYGKGSAQAYSDFKAALAQRARL